MCALFVRRQRYIYIYTHYLLIRNKGHIYPFSFLYNMIQQKTQHNLVIKVYKNYVYIDLIIILKNTLGFFFKKKKPIFQSSFYK